MIKIVKQENYDEMIIRHAELMEIDSHYKNAVESLSYEVGQKMELVIEVTDKFLSQNIISLLHGKIEGSELLGFKVKEVVFAPELRNKKIIKEILQKMINDLIKCSLIVHNVL